ncbi:hypothetical protein Tco_1114842 [Tanacetum coccineum]
MNQSGSGVFGASSYGKGFNQSGRVLIFGRWATPVSSDSKRCISSGCFEAEASESCFFFLLRSESFGGDKSLKRSRSGAWRAFYIFCSTSALLFSSVETRVAKSRYVMLYGGGGGGGGSIIVVTVVALMIGSLTGGDTGLGGERSIMGVDSGGTDEEA